MIAFLNTLGQFRALPEYADEVPFPEYDHPDEIPNETEEQDLHRGIRHTTCMLWDRSSVPPIPMLTNGLRHPYRITRLNSDVIELTRHHRLVHGIVTVSLSVDDWVQLPDETYQPIPEVSRRRFQQTAAWIKGRCRFVRSERLYVSHAALERLGRTAATLFPWLSEAKTRRKAPSAQQSQRLTYAASFDVANRLIKLEGQPVPHVLNRPTYEDRAAGPTILRRRLEDQALDNLTLPAVYIGHSDLMNIAWTGSDLHSSTFNWTRFVDCSFVNCNMSDCDLRASEFERCSFLRSDLRGADLRGSTFRDCDFAGANVAGAILQLDQRGALGLTTDQEGSVRWVAEYEAPAGA